MFFYMPIEKINRYKNHPFITFPTIQKMALTAIHPQTLT
jgi:hypothetical protein